MSWTHNDTKALQSWITRRDSDDIRIKEKIKDELVKNKKIIHVLHNKELEKQDASPGDYYGLNILPYYTIDPTQTHVQNFICFETQWEEEPNYARVGYHYSTRKKLRQMKLQQIVFHILCHVSDITEEDTGIARHDLLAALITEQFNWTNILSNKIHLVSSRPSTVDNKYVTRTLIFEQFTDNELVKTNEEGIPRLANKDIVTSTKVDDSDDEIDPSSL